MISNKNPAQLQLLTITFVLSAAMLAYEILLTRIASVLLTSQYVFLILGIALLGISIGAIIEYFIAKRQKSAAAVTPGMWLCWSAVVLALSLVMIVKLGAVSGKLVLALSTALPFAVAGFVFSRLFRLYTQLSGSLYAADLIGAAAGAMLVPFLLPEFGPTTAILGIAGVLAIIGFIFVIRQRRGAMAAIGLTIMLGVVALGYMENSQRLLGRIPIGRDHNKDLYRLSHIGGEQAQIIDSRWSTFGRSDLVRFAGDTSAMSIFIDGAAGASMLRFNNTFDDSSASFVAATHQFGGMIPLLNLEAQQKDNALIIGPGGGRDVLLALIAGFENITAVEINPQMVDIVRDYKDYNGGIYSDIDNVNVLVAEGRDFLRHSEEKYDLIMLFMPITKSSRSGNAFALSENYLFTQEAFNDYHDHLTDEGSLLIMGHGMPEIAKMMTTALGALQTNGMSVEKAMDHVYILGSQMMPLFGMRKTPLQENDSAFLHAAAHYTMFDCSLSYIPGVEQQLVQLPISTAVDAQAPMMNPLFIDLAEGRVAMDELVRNTGFNLVPATDDQPFFFQYTFELPLVLQVVLWLALGMLAVVLFVPGHHFRLRQAGTGAGQFSWWLPVFFVAIGVGYIVIELVLFQKLVFYLGDPSRSLAILLAALLVGSGVGSFVTRNASTKIAITGGISSAIVALLILIALPLLFSLLHDTSLAMKQVFSALILFIQGVPMGFMFPVGLRTAEAHLGKPAVPWMWAINGSASVAGSALAITVAMSFGYAWSLVFGALCYAIAGAAIFLTTKKFNTIQTV